MDGVFATGTGSAQAGAALRPRRLTDAQIRIIRLTLARTCTDAEFDHFIAVAERAGLDPLRRQISAIIVRAADPAKREMIPLVTIDGLRAIAARTGDYRPMEEAPVLDFDTAKKDEALNPLGLVRAEVKVWRRFGEVWFPITGEAWWDEYAAIPEAGPYGDEAATTGGAGRTQRLSGHWRRMGRVLLAKCAEAQALRRGWPEDFSGLCGEEELHRAELEDLLAHERADRAAEEARQRVLAGSRTLLIAFDDGALEAVPRPDIALKLAAFIATSTDIKALETFQARNRDALKTFWDWCPGDALDIKRQMERALVRLRAADHDDNTQALGDDTATAAGRRRAARKGRPPPIRRKQATKRPTRGSADAAEPRPA